MPGLLLNQMRLHHEPTYWHSIRTAKITAILSVELGIAYKDRPALIMAALLHDVGKDRIPKVLLDTPDELKDKEWELIRQHPLNGANMLTRQGFGKEIIKGVCSHHEWFDGSGYPHGLKGKLIPWQSRVIAVADALDAIVSRGQNRTIQQAIIEIQRKSREQFDPYIISRLPKQRLIASYTAEGRYCLGDNQIHR